MREVEELCINVREHIRNTARRVLGYHRQGKKEIHNGRSQMEEAVNTKVGIMLNTRD